MLRKLPIVGVFGHGASLSEERVQLARAVGAMIAQLDAHLLTGGGYGVMEAAADGFVAIADRMGTSIGIIPCKTDGPLDCPNRSWDGRPYPNPFVELPIFTPLPPRDGQLANYAGAQSHQRLYARMRSLRCRADPARATNSTWPPSIGQESGRGREDRRTVLLGPIDEFTPHHRRDVHPCGERRRR